MTIENLWVLTPPTISMTESFQAYVSPPFLSMLRNWCHSIPWECPSYLSYGFLWELSYYWKLWGIRVRVLKELLGPVWHEEVALGLHCCAALLSPPLPSLHQALLHPSICLTAPHTVLWVAVGVSTYRLPFRWYTRTILLIDAQYLTCYNGHAQV